MSRSSLSELVKKAFCINLNYRPERWNSARQQFADADINVEKFNAIDGREFNREYPMKPGNCGCNLSHFLIIQQAHLMGLDAIMVFEDDVVLRDKFIKRMDECLQDLPEDWELLMLGASHYIKPTPETERIYRLHKSFCSHSYIMRSSLYRVVLKKLWVFNQPLDYIFTELQKNGNVYITNPPMAWQKAGYSDIEEKLMSYDWLKSNEQ